MATTLEASEQQNAALRREVARLEHALAGAQVLEAMLARPDVVERVAATLTQREVEILGRIMMGESAKEVARALFVSQNTVKNHIRNIYIKLSVHNRGAAVMAGINLGLEKPR